jgi:hypothetical protein
MRLTCIGLMSAMAVVVAGASAAGGKSGLAGVVRKGPITPVCVVGRPCTAPAPGVTLVFSRSSRDRARAVSGRNGTYRVTLEPGVYRVRALVKTRRQVLKPFSVHVPVGRVARLNFMLDTGIR